MIKKSSKNNTSDRETVGFKHPSSHLSHGTVPNRKPSTETGKEIVRLN